MKTARLATFAGVLLAITALPAVGLAVVGGVWLWQHDLLLPWLGATTGLSLAGWLGLRVWVRPAVAPPPLNLPPNPRWSTEAHGAWDKVEALATELKAADRDVGPNDLWPLLHRTLNTVAQHFHPRQRDPLLELKVPYLLRAIELLAQDLRRDFTDHVPASHLLSVNDVWRGYRLTRQGQRLYDVFRVMSAAVNPAAAALREAQGYAVQQVLAHSSREIRRWLVDTYVKKLGYYAVELYAGHLTLEDEALGDHVTAVSRQDFQDLADVADRQQVEPLRFLVMGQRGSGKTQLIAALLATRDDGAAITTAPLAKPIPYALVHEGLDRTLIIDTPGYASDHPTVNEDLIEAAVHSDGVILVTSALAAARRADREQLDRLGEVYRQRPGEAPPRVVVALSHIDQLRPLREWDPPYDVVDPKEAKARHIRRAMEGAAEDLALELERVVPVCLAPGRHYNVLEGLVPVLLQDLDHAQRLQYLRCLRDYNRTRNLPRLWRQAQNVGRFVARGGMTWLQQLGEQLNRQPPR
ncbi:MAG: GTPase family protein [Candidatus Competibacterales bacterium]